MQRRIAVAGAGAIGSCVAADLSAAGYTPVVVDQWPAQVDALKSDDLTIAFPEAELRTPVGAMHLHELAASDPIFDIVFLAVKGNDHRWMAELMRPHLAPDGLLVGLQNGMNDDSLAEIVGRERVVGCSFELSAEIFVPGRVQRNTDHDHTWFCLGELDGRPPGRRIDELVEIVGSVGRVETTEHISAVKWTKLIANTMMMGPFGLLGLKNADARQLPGFTDVALSIGRESLAVGTALGYRIQPVFGLTSEEMNGVDDEILVRALETLVHDVGRHSRTAPIHDYIKGRRSEMDYITGVVCREGRRLGIPTPCNDAVKDLYRMIHRGELEMDVSNYDLLLARLGVSP